MSMWMSIFFFNDTATTEIYTLSLHDALPILGPGVDGAHALSRPQLIDALRRGHARRRGRGGRPGVARARRADRVVRRRDRKSTRLNSSHANISYAVFCLEKKKHPLPLPQDSG